MGGLLIADAEQAATVFDWTGNVIVPAVFEILGGLLTLFVGWAIVSRTEWYRRLSKWEFYGEHSWKIRFESAMEMVRRTEKELNVLWHCFEEDDGRRRAAGRARKQIDFWGDFGLCLAFLSDEICIVRAEFYEAIHTFINRLSDEGADWPDFQPVMQAWVNVIGAIQKEFQVKGLSSASKETLQKFASTAINRKGKNHDRSSQKKT